MEKTSLRTLRVNGSIIWSKLCREEKLAWAWEISQGPSCPQAWVLTACQAESPVLAQGPSTDCPTELRLLHTVP